MDKPNNDIFNYFNDETKKVLITAQKIAHDSNTITGTQHLLLSLLITPNICRNILNKHLLRPDQVKLVLKLEDIKEKTTKTNMTEEFQTVLKLAIDNSQEDENNAIDPRDLLWAILTYKQCAAYKIFTKLGVDKEAIRLSLANQEEKNNEFPTILFGSATMPKDLENMPNQSMFIDMPLTSNMSQMQTKTKESYLTEFGLNLTDLAKNHKLDPVVGREEETNRLIQILCRRNKNNPVLVGDSGVGKTAIIEGLAQRIATGNVPLKLINKQIIAIDLAMTIAGTMYRGQFETRIKKILAEVKKDPNIILFIDEIHTIVGSGSAEGSMDTANILKPVLTRGEIRLIGATTTDEYRKYIEKDNALERRLQKIIVEEPSEKNTLIILKELRKNLEKFHQVTITDSALQAAVKLSSRYISDRSLPDKAIDLLDEAAAATNLRKQSENKQKLTALYNKQREIILEKDKAIKHQDFAKAAYLRSRELQLKQDLAIVQQKDRELSQQFIIDEKEIAKVVSLWTQIPMDNLIQDDVSEINNIEQKIAKNIIGQNEAIAEISSAIKKAKSHLSDPSRPLGVFMFLGPTGVGKTQLAKTLSHILFGSEKKLLKIDMSEFMERHNVSRLVGAPPGYVGFDEAGKLTEAIRNNPHCVILFDEIEKAHPEIFNLLLQIMEDGYLTDAKGRRVNFRNTIIIMTSNLGVAELNKAAIGFTKKTDKDQFKHTSQNLMEELKRTFKLEFLNRLDHIIIFKPLTISSIKRITYLELSKIKKRLSYQHIKLDISAKAIEFIVNKGFNPEYGAREIRRTIDKYITKPIAQLLITNKKTTKIDISIKDSKLIFK